MRFYLDEDLPPRAAARVREQGGEATCSRDCGRNGATDDAQLAFAGEHGWVMVTRNYSDFYRWTREFKAQGLPHAGVLMVPPSLPNERHWEIGDALLRYAAEHPDGMPAYMIDWLKPASE